MYYVAAVHARAEPSRRSLVRVRGRGAGDRRRGTPACCPRRRRGAAGDGPRRRAAASSTRSMSAPDRRRSGLYAFLHPVAQADGPRVGRTLRAATPTNPPHRDAQPQGRPVFRGPKAIRAQDAGSEVGDIVPARRAMPTSTQRDYGGSAEADTRQPRATTAGRAGSRRRIPGTRATLRTRAGRRARLSYPGECQAGGGTHLAGSRCSSFDTRRAV